MGRAALAYMSDLDEGRHRVFQGGDLPLLLALGLGLYLGLSAIGRGLDGPSYLVAFVLIWVFLIIVDKGVRSFWRDSFAVSAMAAAVLVAVAFARYSWGVQQGMRRWDFLIIMTVVGCVTFFFRASRLDSGRRGDVSDTSWWSSSCGAASSGGGGGCGGGCGGGGCGGCGGG
jgi:hypothetical protein